PTTTSNTQDKWDTGNTDAFTSMLLTKSDSEVEKISRCTTASEIWEKLSKIYQSTSGESKQVLFQKFYGVMEDHYNSPVRTMCEIQNLAAQLGSMGTQIDDDAIIARAISSLMSERFRQFCEACKSVDSTKQTSVLLLARLKTWEL
ncbi:unnamed protein product, partial [Allacma fusca]